MVSSKSLLGLAALVLLSVASTSGTVGDIGLITNVCSHYYDHFGFSFENVFSTAVNLVGGVIQLGVSIVGGLLDSVLGIFGFGSRGPRLDSFFRTPTSRGAHIELVLRLAMACQPILNQCSSGLGDLYLEAIFASLTLGVSVSGGDLDGLKLTGPLHGSDRHQWWDQLKCEDLLSRWRAHLNGVGGLDGLTGVRGVLYGLVAAVFDVLNGGVDAIDDILTVVLCHVYGVFGLLGNVAGGFLESVLSLLFGWHDRFGFGGNFNSYHQQFIKSCGGYSQNSFNDLFGSA